MIYDISMDIYPNMQVYKNKTEKYPKIKQVNFFDKHGVYESEITMNLHTGTHIDYPLHAIEKGSDSSIEDLNVLIGKAKVFDLSVLEKEIEISNINKLDIKENDFVIFKTKNSFSEDFDFNFVYVNESAARYLVEKKIRGIGIDSLGIERNQDGHPTHNLLLGNNIIILEGLRLKDISEDTYDLYCLPLKIKNVEASPVRAILIK
jgi:arylformamidase